MTKPEAAAEGDGEPGAPPGEDTCHWLRSSKISPPSGQTFFSFRLVRADEPLLAKLYVGAIPGEEAVLAHEFPMISVDNRIRRLIFLPPTVSFLQLRAHEPTARFEISGFRIHQLGSLPFLTVLAAWWLTHRVAHPRRLVLEGGLGLTVFFRKGPQEFRQRLVQAQIDYQNTATFTLRDRPSPGPGFLREPRWLKRFVGRDGTKDTKEAFTASWTAKLDRFLASAEILRLASPKAPCVSIVVIVHNRAELTLACLQSVATHAGDDYEILLVDNASTDRTGKLLEQVEGITVLDNDENVGFAKACNQAVEQAHGDYVLLLNNDATIDRHTLPAALSLLEGADDIGVVGARVVLLDDTLQEAGCIVWSDGSCQAYGRGDDPACPEYMYQREVDFCSGAFLLTPRAVWEALDGFDEAFAPAYYEDVDYWLRVRQAGWRTVYQPRSVVLHYEFASSSSPQRAIDMQERNRKILVAKHAEILRSHHDPSPDHVLQARSTERKPRVLLIDDRVPHHYLGGGCPRANFMLHTLVEIGYAVTFFPKQFPEEDWRLVYTDLPPEIEVATGHGNAGLEAYLEARQGFYDAFVVSRPHNMADFARIVRSRSQLLGDAKLIYDAEAIFALREIEERRFRGNPMKESSARTLIDKELEPAHIADQVMVVSALEQAAFVDSGIESPVLLGHCVEPTPTPNPFADRADFLFVGSLAMEPSPNVDSILWFLDSVFPALRRALKARGKVVEFLVAGQNTSPSLAARRDPGIRFLGVVEDLTPYYNRARAFVAPTRFAAGIPCKILEASGHGLPVVATQLLTRQLGWKHGEDLMSADPSDPASFIDHCIRLYTDERLWTTLRENALARVEEQCSPGHFASVINEVFSARSPGAANSCERFA